MAIGKVEIWNMALGFLGLNAISSESEASLEALVCSTYWALARRSALRDFPYSFAQKRIFLTNIPLAKEYEQDYAFAYALPDNCLKIHSISNKDSSSYAANHASSLLEKQYEIVQMNEDSLALVCNVQNCLLSYTSDIQENISFTDDSFVEMLAYKLASCICTPLLKDNSNKLKLIQQIYQAKLAQAIQNEASSKKKLKNQDSWVGIVVNN